MAIEIEKKFLLKHLPSLQLSRGTPIRQGYMVNKNDMVVRVRLSGDNAFLTIKGLTCNASRKEYEYPVPQQDAREMLSLFCKKPLIEKTRYQIEFKGFEWVIDLFSGSNKGLVVAEIELDSIDQPFEKPDWIGKEVTHDPRYFNSNLIKAPYSTW
ncbi:MAG: CYTH domain-containing protein [Deltaproteobacteria bacterium]|uniref:CYTH domain-containing protein n=1 Tax=Desulfobacula sp. TaxID=2593537 RepID=UPI0019B61953|nr:CYTH domain-containing protein [Candidatus Desulfobacula maris]MBL6994341.1 CYTH domain-containing protein [Desulfobacula sp.]